MHVKSRRRVLSVPGSANTYAATINGSGVIVGTWTDSSGVSHGFLATPKDE
jgi:hypothetical protein